MMREMRATLTLLLIVVLAAFAAGWLTFTYRLAPRPELSLSQIVEARQNFQKSHTPSYELNLAALVPPAFRKELLDPRTHLPQSAHFEYAEISALYRYAQNCRKADFRPPRVRREGKATERLDKAWLWHQFACHQLKQLPDGFFLTAPLMHPSGSSFVFMAWRSGLPPFTTHEWLSANLPYTHFAERSSFPSEIMGEHELRLARIDNSALAALNAGSGTVLLGQEILLRHVSRGVRSDGAEDSRYDAFPLRDFRQALAESSLAVAPWVPNRACLLREGNGCFFFNAEPIYGRARFPILLLLFATLGITIALTAMIIKRVREQRLEEERKRFALQTLTHELRTPITSLLVSIESLRREYDSFSPDVQDAFFRICDDLQRLQRLAESSRNFLSSENSAVVQARPNTIPSLREFIERVIEPFKPKVELSVDSSERPIHQDGYWLGVCLKNLVENGIKHGHGPVTVKANATDATVRIEISDGGNCVFDDLDEMVRPFARSEGSTGLGLGLSIVERAIREMGGHLRFHKSPTTFTITLPMRTEVS